MLPLLRGIVVKAPVLTSVVHGVGGSCPSTEVSVGELASHANAPWSGGESEFLTLWISEAKASRVEPIDLKYLVFEHFSHRGNRTPVVLT